MATTLHATKLLVVEGRDEEEFLAVLLGSMGIHSIQIHNARSMDKIPAALLALIETDGFDDVATLAVVRDADDDPERAGQSCFEAITRAGLTPPEDVGQFSAGIPRVGIFLMPGRGRAGMLEDALLETVAEQPAMTCVDIFLECLGEKIPAGVQPGNPTKARAQAFLASMRKPVRYVGEAARDGCWNLDHPSLDELKSFLARL